jgi:pimeloyl-ACP methyl ester carboxylesterase|tara:strand:- start:87 stop:941 length:855 start_codon:yes stop_codon:yes gene_type:complete
MTITSNISAREAAEIEIANASGKPTVVFIHGLWLLAPSWKNWVDVFEEAGFAAVALDWPGDPETVAQANANPKPMAKKSIKEVVDRCQSVIENLEIKPIIVGHSFGGLMAQMLASRGLAKATVAISPAPFRGVLPLPISVFKATWPVLSNLANRGRAIALTYQQFKYGFANAVPDAEAKSLHSTVHVPAPGLPIFQAATANLNPWTQAKVDTRFAGRGPLLIIAAEKDHTVPLSISRASFRLQSKNKGLTEIVEMKARGHSLVFDSGWEDVAKTALSFVSRNAG